ncbi:Uncharacterized protein PECH_005810 [Penicillium ucsense]|uniref:Uncharacterized protein n=1 Tax=Penicillium ucsense TaxID=2839758 RepID=A0A8J8WME0_9EURO|nr:Uncharacterized protein PECM_003263 [Penicillium ucsense]KAF7736113.1 Uncharacterized protein PECH_005810 [Penicillium ucsense]
MSSSVVGLQLSFSVSLLRPLIHCMLAPVVAGIETDPSKRSTPDQPSLDKALLGIQIGSIAGAYLVFVAVLLGLLLLVGRRLRRTVQSSNYSLQMHILQPVKQNLNLDPNPKFPMSHHPPGQAAAGAPQASWGNFPSANRPSQNSSTHGSVVTIDESVVASDRQRAQDQMAMLYAAVLEHDAQKSIRDSDSPAHSPDSQYTNPFTDRHASQQPLGDSYREPLKSPKPSGSRLTKLFSSKSSSQPDGGKLRSPRFPLRKLGISSPLASPDMHVSHSYGPDQAPLSPRLYNPGPPPATPRAAPPVAHIMPPPNRTRAAPAPLNLSTPTAQTPSSLPFREAYPLQSAPPTKTTILERPTKTRNGPMTGMPTPYSAYMPYTPVTPFTPGRMVTRRERRREERENGLRVLNEDDLVKDDQDVWG